MHPGQNVTICYATPHGFFNLLRNIFQYNFFRTERLSEIEDFTPII